MRERTEIHALHLSDAEIARVAELSCQAFDMWGNERGIYYIQLISYIDGLINDSVMRERENK